jgi:hypothetical protein
MSEIIDFYEGKKTSCRHNLSDIWSYSFERLEDEHDYIQWMFPLNEPSAHNNKAPILTAEDIKTFRESPMLKWRVMTSVHTFMRFLHFTTGAWLCEYDHNHLRITRILKCLMLFGMEKEAEAVLSELRSLVIFHMAYLGDPNFMAKPMNFWFDAVNGS